LGEIRNEEIESALHGDFEVLLFNATIDDNKEGYGTSKKEKKRTLSNDNPGVNHLAPYDSDFIFIMFFNSSAHEDS